MLPLINGVLELVILISLRLTLFLYLVKLSFMNVRIFHVV